MDFWEGSGAVGEVEAGPNKVGVLVPLDWCDQTRKTWVGMMVEVYEM